MPALQENVCNPYAPRHQFLQSLSSKSFGKRKEFGIRLTRALCYLLNLTEDHHIVHPPPPLSVLGGWVEVEPRTEFSKRGGFTEPQFLEGAAGKEIVPFFKQGVAFFSIKNELKTGIFNDKKILETRMLCCVITKNQTGQFELRI